MKIRIGWILIVVGIFLMVATVNTCAAEVATVCGRVVGEDGKPVVGAGVVIAYEGGHYLASAKSGDNGRFEITFPGPIRRRLYLYSGVDAVRDHEDEFLVDAPFGGALWGEKKFAGIPFDMGERLTYDAGDISLQYWFNDVHVRLTRNRRKLVVAEWERLWVVLKDQRGRKIHEQSFAPSITPQADINSSEMRIMLPEGDWSFDFKRYVYGKLRPSTMILGQTRTFSIRRHAETVELCVELSDF
ncbi:MAG: carboxypeptidase regulatory-like domain-containing protein [Acidobacteria bacterium]|nr:carboxypeptidase regulatory-like domain-containing protein [Acidobacteriota bacterium]